MIKFIKLNTQLLLSYTPKFGPEDWINESFEDDDSMIVKKTFAFKKSDLVDWENPAFSRINLYEEPETAIFILAELEDDYFKMNILINDYDIFFHKNIKLKPQYFIANPSVSIFRSLNRICKQNIYRRKQY